MCSPTLHSGSATTIPVLLETANALARPAWRPSVIALIDHVHQCQDVEIPSLKFTYE